MPWPTLAGAVALLTALAAWLLVPDPLRDIPRERLFDRILPALTHRSAAPPDVVIVDIDRATLSALGAWPWPRGELARIVAAIAAGEPACIALDMLLSGPDRWTPDGDSQLAEALAAAPAVLGFVLETRETRDNLPKTLILARQPIALSGLWRAPGVGAPLGMLADAAAGFGTLVMDADPDGQIRRVPLLVSTNGIVRPGLAVAAVLAAREAGALIIQGDGTMRIADRSVPLGTDARLRFMGPARDWSDRTISAVRLLREPALRDSLKGKIVLLGGSAPELGGLRESAASPATPTVWLQAEAIATILHGGIAFRPVPGPRTPNWPRRRCSARSRSCSAHGSGQPRRAASRCCSASAGAAEHWQ